MPPSERANLNCVKTIGRFAPSPTSDLHIGNLRTAVLAWLFANAEGGEMLLRVEDLDQQRVAAAPGVARRQIEDLRSLGLSWPEPVWRQSERIEVYREAASKLETYECFCTRREIAAASQAPHGDYRPYPGTCAILTQAQRDEKRQNRKPAIRVRAEQATFKVHDIHAGDVTGVVDDFVLFRADGTPAYNLAAVVDDGLGGVNQVVRGRDLLDSSPRQAWLASKLGFVVPTYVHVGLAVNENGDRLAKRDGGYTLRDLEAGPREFFAKLCESAGLPPANTPKELKDRLAGTDWRQSEAIWNDWVIPGSLF